MKPSSKKVYQKQKKRKFKHAKQTQITPVTEKKNQPKEEKIPSVKSLSWITRFLTERIKIQRKERVSSPSNRFKKVLSDWLRTHDSDVQLILFPLILLVILIILSVFNNQLFLTLSRQEPVTDNQSTVMHPYPFVQALGSPVITAKSAIILDRGSQVILFSKNPLLRFSMASTTKIMTALVALDYYKLDDILTIKTSNVAGSGLNFIPGEHFHFMDLMYAMLLPSANDAAQAIADNYPGGENAFVKKMNEKAQSLNLTNTHYSDPIGLDDDGDYSTVVDMARLASYAVANTTFVDVTSTKYKTIYSNNFARKYPLTSTNDLLGIDGVTGIKTGTTEGAGEVLVTSVIKNGHEYIIVVMDSTNRFEDTSKLLNFIDSSVKYVIPPPPVQ
jgi:D-alanyl-D-alanine carboxypeptidase